MNILALDPGLACGFAHTNGLHGVWHLSVSGSEHSGKRLLRLKEHLRVTAGLYPIDSIVYEASPQMTRGQAARSVHAQLTAVILMFAAEIGVPYQEVHASTLKKFATDDGHAKKQAMIAALKRHWGIEVRDDNTADAIWLLKYAESGRAKQATPKPVRPRSKVARGKAGLLF